MFSNRSLSSSARIDLKDFVRERTPCGASRPALDGLRFKLAVLAWSLFFHTEAWLAMESIFLNSCLCTSLYLPHFPLDFASLRPPTPKSWLMLLSFSSCLLRSFCKVALILAASSRTLSIILLVSSLRSASGRWKLNSKVGEDMWLGKPPFDLVGVI